MRRLASLLTASALVALGLVAVPHAPAAQAASLPAGTSGSAGADILGVDVTAVGISLADVLLGHADTDLDATAGSTATGANLGAAIAGINLGISENEQAAPPDNPTASVEQLAAVNLLGAVTAGVADSTVHARWADACSADGQIATSTTSLAQAGVSLLGIGIATVGASQVSTQTALTAEGVTGTAQGSIAGLSLLNGAVSVAVDGTATLEAMATGSPGPAVVDYAAPSVRVTALGSTTSLVPGGTAANITIPFVGTVSISMPLPEGSASADGTSASASVSLLEISVSLLPIIGAATATIDVLPMTAEATAAAVPTAQLCIDDPAITAPEDGSSSNDATPTIAGTGEPEATIDVALDGGSIGTTTVAADGTWTLDVTEPLADDTYTAVATQTIAGTETASAPVDFTIDTAAPIAPVLIDPADGSTIADATPTVTGTGEAGATVAISFDGTASGTTVVDGDGSWSYTPTDELADGERTVTALQTDAAGNASPTDQHTFAIDTTALAPVIEAPADGSATTDTTPIVSGTGEPGATVAVSIDGADAGTAPVDEDGAWSLELDEPLAEGEHTVTATQTDALGNVSPESSSTFAVDLTAPTAPVIDEPADGSVTGDATPTVSGTGEAGATVAVTIDGEQVGTTDVADGGAWSLELDEPLAEGEHTVSATQADAAGNVSPASATNAFTVDLTAPEAPVIDAPADGSVTSSTTPTIVGTGETGSTVTVTVDGTGVGTAPVDEDGAWSLELTDPLGEGEHTVEAAQTDPAGNASSADAVTFEVDTTAPAAPAIETPANGSVTGDATPTVAGTGEPGATVSVEVDGEAAGTADVTPEGTWTLALTTPLVEGPHTVVATQADEAGNVSPESSSTFAVDLTAPGAPVIEAPADGSVTSDATPTVSGTGEEGATVSVVIDGTTVGTAPVTEGGLWSLDPSLPLDDGPHTATATQTDPAGNVSEADAVEFTVDATAPAAPVIEAPADGSVTGDATPTVSGTGEAGATVTVAIDGSTVGTAPVDEDGAWSLALETPLIEGEHTASATQADAAGNTSPAASNAFEVDLTAPAAPVIEAPADGTVIADATPTVSGTGEPGASVDVIVDGAELGDALVDEEGAWSLELTEPLDDGEHTIEATQTDAGGNASEADSVTFAVDTTAPAAPVIVAPADGSTTGDTTPTVSGTGEPGSTVAVTIDGSDAGTAPVDEDGSWSLELSDPLTEGEHTAEATQADAAGNTSEPASSTFLVDLTAPAAPVIEAPADGALIADATPTISGTGEAGAIVTVVVDGAEIGTAPVDADGAWSLGLTDPLGDGEHTIEATQTDAGGNASEADSVTFAVDTTAPVAPVIEAPADGALQRDATPTVSGTGEPGATVTVAVDGTDVGTTPVDEDGTWSLELTEPLADGEHTIDAVQTDLAGNDSAADTVTITVDTTAPAAPVVTSPADGAVTGDATPTVSGTGEPGAIVTVVVDGADAGTALVDEDGAWSLDLTEPLSDGEHTIDATQTDVAGNPSDADSVTFAVDTAAPAAPVVAAPADGSITGDATPTVSGTGEPGATVAVAIDGTEVGTAPVDEEGAWSLGLTEPLSDGEHAIEATQTDAAGNASDADGVTFGVDTAAPAAPVVEAPADGSVTSDATPTVSGTGEPGATVAVAIDGTEVGTAPVDEGGDWSLQLTEPLTDGEHTVEATQTDAAGNTSAPGSTTFGIDTTAPAAPAIETPADGSVTNDATPTIAGTGEPGATVTVAVDGTSVGSADVDDDGSWSLELTEPLLEGPHTAEATQTDAAGNTSAASTSTFAIDLTAPASPIIEAPADGELTDDPTPTVSGTGEPGATVTVVVDGEEVGSAAVDEDGTWSIELDEPLGDGDHTIEATQTDEAGNASAPDVITVTVDATAPAAPAIESPADGSATADTTPTVSGTGEPGATVTVSVDGEPVGTALVDEDGTWSLELDEPLTEGERAIGATQTDAAGNTSPETAIVVTVDTEVEAPTIESPTEGQLSDDTTPTVSGTGEPGATVTVTVDGEPVGTVVVDEDGEWSLELDEPLSDGEHTIGASQQDAAGNESAETRVTVTIDATAPDAPVIESPADGDVIDDRTPTIEGTGEPGATIIVTVDGEPAGIVVVDADGGWSIELDGALADGHHEVTVIQVDAAGNASAPTTVVFEVDAGAGVPQPGDGAGVGGDGSGGGGDGSGTGSGGGSLPRTGGELPAPIVLLGLLLLLGGAALTRVRRRSA